MVNSSKTDKNLPSVCRDMPSVNIFCEAIKNSKETDLSVQIKQADAAYRLFNPLSEVIEGTLAKEMPEKIKKARKPVISQCIAVNSKRISSSYEN